MQIYTTHIKVQVTRAEEVTSYTMEKLIVPILTSISLENLQRTIASFAIMVSHMRSPLKTLARVIFIIDPPTIRHNNSTVY